MVSKMKYLVVSDNHGDHEIVDMIAKAHPHLDGYIHCGDSESQPEDPHYAAYHMVAGNCDWLPTLPNELILDGGIYVTHGHMVGVKMDRRLLAQTALENGCRYAFYGHTHVRAAEVVNGVYCINPGSIRLPRRPYEAEKSYAIVTIEEAKVLVQYYDERNHLLEERTLSNQ